MAIDARRPKEALNHPNVVLEPIGRDQRESTPGRVSRQLVGEGGRWIVAGAVLGLLLTWSTGHILESQLFGVSPTDGLSIGIALLVLLVALFLALCGPAARAARVDPMTALREE